MKTLYGLHLAIFERAFVTIEVCGIKENRRSILSDNHTLNVQIIFTQQILFPIMDQNLLDVVGLELKQQIISIG